MCHWKASEELRLSGERRASSVPQADSISIETTAYALLQTLLGDDAQYATRIARWLTEQRQYGGGFRSTQVRPTLSASAGQPVLFSAMLRLKLPEIQPVAQWTALWPRPSEAGGVMGVQPIWRVSVMLC